MNSATDFASWVLPFRPALRSGRASAGGRRGRPLRRCHRRPSSARRGRPWRTSGIELVEPVGHLGKRTGPLDRRVNHHALIRYVAPRRQPQPRAARRGSGVLHERRAVRQRDPPLPRDPRRPRAEQCRARRGPRRVPVGGAPGRCPRGTSDPTVRLGSSRERRDRRPSRWRSCSWGSLRAGVCSRPSSSSPARSTPSPTSRRTRDGLRVQRVYGRSIVNSFHGIWSVGAVAGGLMGAATIALDVSLETALVTASVLFALSRSSRTDSC